MDMKKVIFTVLVAAIGTTAIAKNAGEKASKVSIRANMEVSTLSLIYNDKAPSSVTVTIADPSGRVVTKDKIKNQEGFYQPYDLSQLTSGIYAVSMHDEHGVFFTTSVVVNNALSAVRKHSDTKYQVTFADDKPQRVTIGIYDGQGQLVFKESVTSKSGFSKVYNLAEIDSRHYTFEVTSEDKVESHTL